MKIWVIFLFRHFCLSTQESLQFSEDSKDGSEESGTSISFELRPAETAEASKEISKEVTKGVIDNDQVFCSWEDVDARDEMATKMGTELCRFSMVSSHQ